jgi:hypothetical protein
MTDEASSSANDTEPADSEVLGRTATLTVQQVSQHCQKARSTVMRAIAADSFPNAWQDTEHPHSWHVPVGDLIEHGWNPGTPLDSDSSADETPDQTDQTDSDSGLRQRVSDLETLLAVTEERVTGLTGQLERADRIEIALQGQLRALGAGSVAPIPLAEAASAEVAAQAELRKIAAMGWRTRRRYLRSLAS